MLQGIAEDIRKVGSQFRKGKICSYKYYSINYTEEVNCFRNLTSFSLNKRKSFI